MSERLAVFAYGSLVAPASAELTLGRPVDPLPARLSGWRRRWTIARHNERWEKTFEPADGSEPFEWCLGLDLEPDPGGEGPNGALIGVSAAELERLDERELRYDPRDVSAGVAGHGFDRVHAFTAKPEHHHAQPPPHSVVIAAYLRTVEAAFDALGAGQLDLFRETTGAPPARVVEARLVADHIPEGNPREW